ncbi:hypothetical protein [Lactobacillus delbrueckii]|uniref:hypothetical protein n=1 Tax=Lactobacillus delbrueckii TaxID=1584 RepID=UPI001E44985F|nr:hypothetical protein [Lactobacillus delbrueckii]
MPVSKDWKEETMSEYMSISKAAEYLNVAKSTLHNWEAEGAQPGSGRPLDC